MQNPLIVRGAIMTLQHELDAIKSRWIERVGPQNAQMMADDIASQGGMLANAAKVGDAFPAVTLSDQNGQPFDIGAAMAGGPLVVTFYRGGWCPHCNLELRAYQHLLHEIDDLGARFVAVSPEKPDNSLTTVEKNALTFRVLSDADGVLSGALGIRYAISEPVKAYLQNAKIDVPAHNGAAGWSLVIPATYVVRSGGRIALAHVDPDYRKRLDPQAALSALRNLG